MGKHWGQNSTLITFGYVTFCCFTWHRFQFCIFLPDLCVDVPHALCALCFNSCLGVSHRVDKVVEALMCNFPDKVRKKKVSYSVVPTDGMQKIRGDATCRYSSDSDWEALVDHRCIPEEAVGGAGKVCSCPHWYCFSFAIPQIDPEK